MDKIVRLRAEDNVVVANRTLEAGYDIGGIVLRDAIPAGHKIASSDISAGARILKYGQTIGYAMSDIPSGTHLRDTFMGYRRENGSVGTRNYIAIVTSVNCSATAARRIADSFGEEELSQYPNVDGVVAFVHGTGCGMAGDGEGFEALQRVMWGYAKHPNHGGVVMVGLGCEMNQIEMGVKKVREMLPIVNAARRTPCPASELKVALQCGGSDAWSGITANPALGEACDLLVAQGGTGVLAETPEIYGAEHLLTERAIDRATGDRLIGLINWWEDYTARNRGSMDNNPSPGNKKGGLTTILEKSLGAAAKGGTTPLTGVYKYAEPVRARGFTFMDSPGYDPASVTGQIAGGCNLVCFTTGRGSAFGSKPAPTIKLSTNTAMYERMVDDMDINCGDIITGGATIQSKGREIYDLWFG